MPLTCGEETSLESGQFRDLKAGCALLPGGIPGCLAGKLQELGFGAERKTGRYFEIAGVPKDVLKRFSRVPPLSRR